MSTLPLLLLALVCQPADQAVSMPQSAPPQFALVRAVASDGTLELLRTNQKQVMYTYVVPVKVFQNGQEIERQETRQGTRWVHEFYVMKMDPARGKVQTAEGKPIAAADLRRRLKAGDLVFVATDEKVDPVWLKALRPETAVLLLPPAGIPMPAGAAPAKATPPVAIPSSVPAPPATKPAPKLEFEATETETALLKLTNAERQKAGALPLVASPLLFKAARQHTANMAKQGSLQHTLDGKGVAERLNDLGYGWSHCAENIAKGQRTPEEAINSWMQSPGHRDNLLSTENTQIGLAVATGTDGQQYWAMVLGRPR